jgi:hypothetical protein
MKRRDAVFVLALAAGMGTAVGARAQTSATTSSPSEIEVVQLRRYKSPQRFAFELRFGPYMPDIDSEFDGARRPYQDFYGDGARLITQTEFDYEILHRFGTVAVGAGLGYFSASETAPVGSGTGLPSIDKSTLKIIPVSVSAIYRFDYFLETRRFPLVPFGKLGLDWAYWQITDGNDEIATDGQGGTGRGGTLGWHAAAGLQFALDFIDPDAARDFDSDLGVNHTSLIFQFTYADISGLGMSDRLHVGDTNWSLGLMFQF